MKLPFERTVSGAYGFAFSNILSVIGIAWFPYLVFAAVIGAIIYFLGPQFAGVFHNLSGENKPNPAVFSAMMGLFWIAYGIVVPVGLLVSAMVTVGLMRKALGLIEGPVFVFFSLGAQVWRLIGAHLLIFVGGYIGFIVIVLVFAGIAGAIGDQSGAATAVAVIGGIVLFCAAVYAFVRIWFFLPAVIVAEDRFGLDRSWSLGGGNFWRIVGIFLVTYLPVAFVAQIILTALLQLTILPSMASMQTETHGPAAPQEVLKTMFEAFVKIGPYLIGVYLLQMVLLNALNAGAVTTAYRALTEAEGSPEAKAPA